MINDGLWDAFNGLSYGCYSRKCSFEKWQITRKEQDEFALSSQTKTVTTAQKRTKI